MRLSSFLHPGLGKGQDVAPVQSFGMIRSEVIASAIMHRRENRDWQQTLGIT
jgi:hypothetical protein